MREKFTLELEISIAPTDSNKILGRHKFAKHAIYKRVKDEIIHKSLGKRPKSPLISFQITAVRHSIRFLDYDNLVTSLKPVIDGLKLAKVIKDDSWKYLRRDNYFPDQQKSNEPKIVLRIEET